MEKLSKSIGFYIYTKFYPQYARLDKQLTSFIEQNISRTKNQVVLFLIAFILFTFLIPSIIVFNTIPLHKKILLAMLYLFIYVLILFGSLICFEFKLMIKEKLVIKKKEEQGFGFKESQIERLYNKLWFDYIDEDKTTKEDFKKVFLKEFNTHSSEVHLKLDHADTKYLISRLKEINSRFTLSKAVKSNKIYNIRGKINQNMLNKAGSANKNIPNSEYIDYIINSITGKNKRL